MTSSLSENELRILFRERGVVDTIRFLNQFVSGLGDYTQERAESLRDETIEELVLAIEKFEKGSVCCTDTTLFESDSQEDKDVRNYPS